MDRLFSIYQNRSVTGWNEEELFSNFFNVAINRHNVKICLDLIMTTDQSKNEDTANKLRSEGNVLYTSCNFMESLHKYTLALCNAKPEGESYGLILANRSAVFFMMNRFAECLSDINKCLLVNCAEITKSKVYIRKIKCCYNMNSDDFNTVVLEALEYLSKCTDVVNKSCLEREIKLYQNKIPLRSKLIVHNNFNKDVIPPITHGFNDCFAFASKGISLRYDQKRGRHVRSNTVINEGDILFIEKPFIFAPIFPNTEDMGLRLNKCYNCLRTIYTCIPCRYCIRCIFCDENCRNISWDEFHQWECKGMRANLWYHIGIAFPALRALLRGIPTGLSMPPLDYQADTIYFGNNKNNYLYFNKLLTNIDKMKNILPLILCAATVVTYLQNYTEYFHWLSQQPRLPKKDPIFFGALLLRHIAQLQCNSSVIRHTDLYDSNDSVACAIYPSVSMMNHSCKPNVTLFYVRDLVIVQAVERIDPDQEIFNCYGIDYRYLKKCSRQEQCLNLYYFKCECRVCKKDNL